MPDDPKIETWTERFQCLRGNEDQDDPTVQIFFKRSIQGHDLDGLEEHKVNLSQLPYLRELLDPNRVLELEQQNAIPAADRVVTRSDNIEAYDAVVDAIAAVEKALIESNQKIIEKDEILEDLSTVRKWMKRGKIFLGVLGSVCVRALVRIRDKTIDTMIKMPVEVAILRLTDLIGPLIKIWF